MTFTYASDRDVIQAIAALLAADGELVRRLGGAHVHEHEMPDAPPSDTLWARLLVRLQPTLWPQQATSTGTRAMPIDVRAQVSLGPDGSGYDPRARIEGVLERAAVVLTGKRAEVDALLTDSRLACALDVLNLPSQTGYRDDIRALERAITITAVARPGRA